MVRHKLSILYGDSVKSSWNGHSARSALYGDLIWRSVILIGERACFCPSRIAILCMFCSEVVSYFILSNNRGKPFSYDSLWEIFWTLEDCFLLSVCSLLVIWVDLMSETFIMVNTCMYTCTLVTWKPYINTCNSFPVHAHSCVSNIWLLLPVYCSMYWIPVYSDVTRWWIIVGLEFITNTIVQAHMTITVAL